MEEKNWDEIERNDELERIWDYSRHHCSASTLAFFNKDAAFSLHENHDSVREIDYLCYGLGINSSLYLDRDLAYDYLEKQNEIELERCRLKHLERCGFSESTYQTHFDYHHFDKEPTPYWEHCVNKIDKCLAETKKASN